MQVSLVPNGKSMFAAHCTGFSGKKNKFINKTRIRWIAKYLEIKFLLSAIPLVGAILC